MMSLSARNKEPVDQPDKRTEGQRQWADTIERARGGGGGDVLREGG